MGHLRIYGAPVSRAFRTLWMAMELGIDYENLPISPFGEDCKTPDYLALNPGGRVPTIDDDGFILWESLAINLYLAKKHSLGRLYPATLEGEARAWQWTLWLATEVEKPAVTWGFNAVVLPPAKRDAKLAAAALAELARPFAVLDGALASRPFLLGADFTVADLNLAAVIYRVLHAVLPATPRIKPWLQRCVDRPAAQAALKLSE